MLDDSGLRSFHELMPKPLGFGEGLVVPVLGAPGRACPRIATGRRRTPGRARIFADCREWFDTTWSEFAKQPKSA